MLKKIDARDLTKEAPRSSHVRLGGFVILARAIDKCRATIAGKNGEYNFDCALDKTLFRFKGVSGTEVKRFIKTGAEDKEIVVWLNKNGMSKTDLEIKSWADEAEADNYSTSDDLEDKVWLEAQNKRLGLPKDGTVFDYLDVDDKTSFKNV